MISAIASDGTRTKVEFARKWWERGECPGCRAALSKVAGGSLRHLRGGSVVKLAGGYTTVAAGHPTHVNDHMGADDPRLCPWSSDDLVSLGLIGGGFLLSKSSTGAVVATLPAPAVPVVPA